MLGNLKSLGNPTSQRLHLDADLHSELWLNKLARLTMMMNRMICILGSSADIPFFLQAFTSDDDDDDDDDVDVDDDDEDDDGDEDVNLHSEIRLNKLARFGARASARSKLVMFLV